MKETLIIAEEAARKKHIDSLQRLSKKQLAARPTRMGAFRDLETKQKEAGK